MLYLKQIFAFETKKEYEKYQELIGEFTKKLDKYQLILENQFELKDKPKGIVWTSKELATNVFSDVPIPAFTNKDIIYFSPDLSSWKSLFIKQLEGEEQPEIKRFYENMSEKQLFTIVGHELTHHSDLFLDDFDDDREGGIWFEEGMCDYISRKYILDQEEFNSITNIELQLVALFKNKYGNHPLEDFGSASYEGSLTSIMFDYWRSFLAIKYLVEQKANNDIKYIFNEYQNWHNEGRKRSLTSHFKIEDLFN